MYVLYIPTVLTPLPVKISELASCICFTAEHLLRTDPEDGLEGFFVSLFVRKAAGGDAEEPNEDVTVEARRKESNEDVAVESRKKQARRRRSGVRAFSSLRLSRMILCSNGGFW
jgi:25S rRNA (cytosine2278-C5)-methyltransferase